MYRSTVVALFLTVSSLAVAVPATAAADPRADIVTLTNAERAKAGCGALKRHTALDTAAQSHSADMAKHNYFSHTGRDGSSPTARMQRAGYPRNTGTGENIAAGYPTAAETVKGWLASAGHRRNMLNCAYKSIGVGYSPATTATYKHYWVQNFGTV
ncbi:hypothetical protein BBK82_00045 [Lentzea guizhouensis]|uniref:SCP domain-containing protein n=1 Tax=Lentzea guizhouensis TaxID=1586287 RepID=A0A1B2HAG8_9PSEU|nr:CAP domain-containing protein [Lentzea guizhouensis]ANZ34708.1 hypothetical protein BBK82_00045 [Lentzea guizhouensis]